MKTICLFGISNSGKTTTLGLLAKTICQKKFTKIIFGEMPIGEKDFLVGFDFDGIKMGIGSEGDGPDAVEKNLSRLISESCDIMIITARSKGGTHHVVYNYCNEHELVWIRQRDIWRESKGSDLDKQRLVNFSNHQCVDLILYSFT